MYKRAGGFVLRLRSFKENVSVGNVLRVSSLIFVSTSIFLPFCKTFNKTITLSKQAKKESKKC